MHTVHTNTMMDRQEREILLQLSQLNTRALDLVCEGRNEDGEAMLSNCLAFALQYLQMTALSSTASACLCSASSPPLSQDCSVHKTIGSRPRSSLMTLPFQGVFSDDDFPMDSPHSWFCFYPFAMDVEGDSVHDLSVLLAMVSYNLAMIHHCVGFVESDFDRLLKARRLYEYATQHVAAAASTASSSDDSEDWPLLTLAVYNNLGHLASAFGDSEGIEICRNVMERGQHYVPKLPAVLERSLARAKQFLMTVAPAA